jgi:outer membrane lipoprotein-sorting protein
MLWLAAFHSAAAAAEQDEKLLELLSKIESHYAKIEDYSALFLKQERVNEKLLPKESVLLKFKKPLQVYMKWTHGPTKEAIYVEGQNGNKVIAHCDGAGAGLTWTLDPKGSILKEDNRHIITDIGFGFIINMMRVNIPKAIKHQELEITRLADDTFEGRPTTALEAKFSPKDGRSYYATRIVCHVDKEYLVPVWISCFDEKDALLEQYGYKDVKINVGLTEMDFSKKNPNYQF